MTEFENLEMAVSNKKLLEEDKSRLDRSINFWLISSIFWLYCFWSVI